MFLDYFDFLDDFPDELSFLISAISRKDYPCIYYELRRYPQAFTPKLAYQLLCIALENRLSLKVIQDILKRSPPVPEILSAENLSGITVIEDGGAPGPVEAAAFLDRDDVLSMLLELGAGPNRSFLSNCSPLEAALIGRAPESVELLIARPELDTAWTDKLLLQWAVPDDSPHMLETCLRTMAPRFTGWDPDSGQPLPIPGPMTPRIIAEARNWPLLKRFCRERGVLSPEDGRGAIEIICSKVLTPHDEDEDTDDRRVFPEPEEEQTACAGALAALLESCPGLLRREKECRALLRCFLCFGGAAQELLLPWIGRLSRRRIAMEREDWARLKYGSCHVMYGEFPDHWRRLLPNGPTLVIDRWSDIFVDRWHLHGSLHDILNGLLGSSEEPPDSAEALRHILGACPVRGKGRQGKLSPLAQTVLRDGDAALIESLFRAPGGLLVGEDPDELVKFVLENDCPRANRAAAVAYARTEAHYDI